MHARVGAMVAVLMLAACGGTSGSTHSPSPNPFASATAGSSPASSSSPSATGPPSLAHCTTSVPAGDNLVIGTVVGDPVIVVRDIQDPANAKNLCTVDAAAIAPQFVAQTSIAYETTDSKLIKADLATGSTTVLAIFKAASTGPYAFSPDGRSVTYIDGDSWHLAGPGGDRVLTTFKPVPGRGASADEDDTYLKFSPDGKYVALFQTYYVGGSAETAQDQIRRAGDGGLVYSTSGMTMAVWASVPSRLYFRDQNSATMHRWDATSGVSSMIAIHWIRPRATPDGRWIAYSFRTSNTLAEVGFYSVQSNSLSATSPPGRSGVTVLTNDLVWYAGEQACPGCFGGLPKPTGVAYIYSIASASEVTSRLSSVFDAWPHFTAPGVG